MGAVMVKDIKEDKWKNVSENVEKLALKGYQVLVVEQTETPDQLEQRREETVLSERRPVDLIKACSILSDETVRALRDQIRKGKWVACPFCIWRALLFLNLMTLDAAASENPEILENNHDGSSSGTPLAQVDHCETLFGKRLLRKWLVRPLKRMESILECQDAIDDIKDVASNSAMNFHKELASFPDMERLLASLPGCQSMIQTCLSFGESMDQIKSSLLQHLLLIPVKGDDESDEEWGKNSTNVDITDDADDEDDGGSGEEGVINWVLDL
eukprot:Gb_33619 [translate_table: standard]